MAKKGDLFDPDQRFDSETDIHGRYGLRGLSGAAFDKFDEAIETLLNNPYSTSDDMNSAINALGEEGIHIEGLPDTPFIGDVPFPAPLEEYEG